MRKRKPELEKKKLGRPSHRTFYTEITFRINPSHHQEIKRIAASRSTTLEAIYCEIAQFLLKVRDRQKIIYHAAPVVQASQRITIKMQPDLKERVFAAAAVDQRAVANFFETAVNMYLAQQL